MRIPVSVLIPAYNNAKLLPETLDSILSQSYPAAEVIVVDDGSADDTRQAVAAFGERVRYHYQANGGICRARNAAAALATSPYIAFCDHDDLWRRDKLEQQMGLFERLPDLTYSFTNFSLVVDGVWADKTKLEDAPDGFLVDLPAGTSPVRYERPLYNELLRFQPIWPSTVVIARAKFEGIGGFLEQLGKNPSEDLEFTLRCLQGGPVGIVREPVVGVRRHPQNYSGDNDKNTRGQVEILEYVLDHHPINEETRALIREQIVVRRMEASHGSFRRGEFDQFLSLLSGVSPTRLDWKTRLKLQIAKLPLPAARTAQKLFLK